METILSALADALTLGNLGMIALGVSLGIFVGAIPGLSSPIAIAIAVPLTYYMSPLAAITFLVGVNKGGGFGGAISAVLLNTPGAPEAAATAFDGYPLAKAGKPEKALKMALYSSVFGDTFSDLVLICVAAPFAAVALYMGPVEISAVLLFALTIIAGLSGESVSRSLIAAAFGILIACVGLDPVDATSRLTFGLIELDEGIPLMAVGIGALALSEIMLQMEEHARGGGQGISMGGKRPKADRTVSFAEFRGCLRTLLRSSVIGTVIGALPGLGATIAGFLGYGAAKRASRNPEQFGKGCLEGIAASEAANSAVVGSNLVPLLTLGIPGNVAAAMLIGAFVIHGVQPGPFMFEKHSHLIYAIFAAMLVANGFHLVLGQLGLKLFAKVTRVPNQIVFPVVFLLCLTGAYIDGQSALGVFLTIGFGVVGYLMRKLDFSFVTFIIGFVVGRMFEEAVRSATILMQNDPTKLAQHPVAVAFIGIAIFSVWRLGRAGRGTPKPGADDDSRAPGAAEVLL